MAPMNKTEKQAQAILDYFKNAFCADGARFVTDEENKRLKCGVPIRLECSDGSGVFYIAQMIDSEDI